MEQLLKVLTNISNLMLQLFGSGLPNRQTLVDISSTDFNPGYIFTIYLPADTIVTYVTAKGDIVAPITLIKGYHPIQMSKIIKTGTGAGTILANYYTS